MGLVFLPLSPRFSHQYILNNYCTLDCVDVGDTTVKRATHFLVSSGGRRTLEKWGYVLERKKGKNNPIEVP